MDSSSYSYTKHGFDVAMANLKNECEDAWRWLSGIPVHTWARHEMDTNCKTDLVVNNISEVFNKYILDVRNKPIVTMINGIKDKLLVRFDGKRESAATSRWEIAPTYAEQLEMSKKYQRDCKAIRAGPNLWQVSSGPKTYAVNLEEHTCGCRKWDMSGLPCNHGCSAIYKAKMQPEDFVSPFLRKAMYLEAYKPIVYPVPGEDAWVKSGKPDIEPPVFHKEDQSGRKEEKRKKGRFEVPKPKDTSRMATIRCGNCRLMGHRFTNCGQPLRPDLQLRKNRSMVHIS